MSRPLTPMSSFTFRFFSSPKPFQLKNLLVLDPDQIWFLISWTHLVPFCCSSPFFPLLLLLQFILQFALFREGLPPLSCERHVFYSLQSSFLAGMQIAERYAPSSSQATSLPNAHSGRWQCRQRVFPPLLHAFRPSHNFMRNDSPCLFFILFSILCLLTSPPPFASERFFSPPRLLCLPFNVLS